MQSLGRSTINGKLSRFIHRYSTRQQNFGIVLGSTILGLLLAGLVSNIETTQQLYVGNTGGSLSVVLELSEARVMIGAGPSRAHAADFIGRTTRPWDREVDLLVLPGWDDQHVAGALGLLERESVSGIAVVGIPDEHPSWTLLEREAEAQDIHISHLGREAQLTLDEMTRITFSEVDGSAAGSWVRLEHGGKRIDIIDTERGEHVIPPPATMTVANEHMLINTRGQSVPAGQSPALAVVPEPFWRNDFAPIETDYQVTLARNEQINIQLDENEIRMPLERVQLRPE